MSSLLSSLFGENLVDHELAPLFEKKSLPSKKRSRTESSSASDDDNSKDNCNKSKSKSKATTPKAKEEREPDSENDSAIEIISGNSESDEDGQSDDDAEISPRKVARKEKGKSDTSSETTSDAGNAVSALGVAVNSISSSKKRGLGDDDPKQQATKNNGCSGPSPQEKDADERTLFVGNLPNDFTRKSLEKIFRPCGPIESTRIRSVATVGVKVPQASAGNQSLVKKLSVNLNKVDSDVKPSIVGYVVFQQHSNLSETIENALKLNNTTVEDPTTKTHRTIRVDHIHAEYDSSRSIFVGNLPYRTDEETLRRHFCQGCDIQDDDIEGVRVVRDRESYQCKGFAYILFKDKTLVSTALRQMHGSTYMNRELRVLVCSRRYKSNQTEPRTKKKKRSSGDDDTDTKPGVAALRRILEKEDRQSLQKNKRVRGKKTSNKPTVKKAGVSRRSAAEAKTNKRVKKIQKRISKGMGKAKKG